jgi:hypothetical protein
MRRIEIEVYEIAVDGLPDMDDDANTGRVAFVWDGYIVSGWPLDRVGKPGHWEAADDALSSVRSFRGVTHWIRHPWGVIR